MVGFANLIAMPLQFPPVWKLIVIALGTLLSEDIACIAAGLGIHRGDLGAVEGVLACFIGIFVGDMLLWCLGHYFGRRLLKVRLIERRLRTSRVEVMSEFFERHAAKAIFISRFMPGMRFPLYVSAGILGNSGWKFAFWTLIAGIIWTPAVVLLVAWLGDVMAERLKAYFGYGWIVLLVMIAALYLVMRLMMRLAARSRWMQNKLKEP